MPELIFGFALIVTVFIVIWLWRSRNEAKRTLTTKSERRRFWVHAVFLVLVTFNPIYLMLIYSCFGIISPLFEEPSGTWHQTIVKDSSQEHEISEVLLSAAYLVMPLIAFFYANLRLRYFEKASKIPYVTMLIVKYTAVTTSYFYLAHFSGIISEFVGVIFLSVLFIDMLTLAATWLQVIAYGRRLYLSPT